MSFSPNASIQPLHLKINEYLAMESGEHMRLNFSRNNSSVAELFPENLEYTY